ncbi:hybrid sensor histidine kinase/response regulator transcription factor [Paenibacillus lautus]|uniref:hybrid sensor histidine kinase/response regulator transcription factor n=1 Tax=Paenibacillus lautus TaxID=1401 RepID=UPI002DB996B6|nr:hybrid sensor histidine kinase/response regulator transcription factor [Paenibacillus lautus]MEC0257853.1 hybrid sensor histidine kinase/response regulator transcription factor [Paenibacillus lautus]
MFDIVKQWKWYDWAMLFIRMMGCISLIITCIEFRNQFTVALWIVVMWELAAFSIPWLCLLLNHKAYLITEVLLSGGIAVYLTSLFPGAYLSFIIPAFLMAANSYGTTYRWTGPLAAILVPILIKLYAPSTDLILMIEHVAFAFALGFAFHLLMANYSQNEMIRTHNTILEQYLSQVERVTLLEERERVSKELHDTMGHTYTAVIMGLETLRSTETDAAAQRKLSNLLELTRRSLDEVRGYLHELDSPQEQLPLVQSLRQVTEDFERNTGVKVGLRVLGEEYPVSRQAKMTFYRCLQESLTNSVRHGNATRVDAVLQFELQQTRLEILDNGSGSVQIQEGFGLSAMKERAYRHQGQLSVYSTPEAGTVVTCSLPRISEPADEVIRLILVDNEPFIRESLGIILESEKDLEVVGRAEHGEHALDMCEKLNPQLVLMDLEMPVMDGITATRLIKQRWPLVKIIIFTTFEQRGKAVEAMRGGADGYLLKSMEPRELAENIRIVYRGGTLMDPAISAKLFDGEAGDFMKEEGGSASVIEADPASSPLLKLYDLTPREIEVLKYLSQGLRYKAIAMKLYLSDGTVRNYASTLYAKLGVRNRDEAVEVANQAGLL